MPKKQPTNRELLDEIQRLREEVQRANARPVLVPQPYPVYPHYPSPYWTRPYINWSTTNIPATVFDNTTVVWYSNVGQSASNTVAS